MLLESSFYYNMPKGLTHTQAQQLLEKFGQNVIEDRQKKTLFRKFIEQISSFLMILLFLASVLSFFIGEVLDGSLILAIIFLNAAFGIYQEYKAEEAVSGLKKLTVAVIRVIRDGRQIEIDSKYLVPGDIMFIEEGVKIPADAKIIETVHLEINEAALTGESIPVVKANGDELFMGTIASKGRGLAEVTLTAMKTKFGEIAQKLSSVQETLTPLQTKLIRLTEIIGMVGIALSLGVFFLSIWQGQPYFPSFLLATSFAIAVVPESLPAVMTVILSIGVKHMAKGKAIIRRLAAIEAIGNITLIATDKTGTLTTNNMEVKEVWFDGTVEEVAKLHKETKLPATLHKLVLDGILCSTATLVSVLDDKKKVSPAEGHLEEYEVLGDPTEGSLLKLAKTLGVEPDEVREEWKLVDEIPFDSIKKRMTVITQDGQRVAFSKGAPESILSISKHILSNGKVSSLTLEKKEEIEKVIHKWATEGYRVLAFSYEECKKDCKLDENHVFLGMTAIQDPPRKEAKDSLEKAASAGIKVVMITGDNERTAESIGIQIGLLKKGEAIMRGDQIESYTDEELLEILPKTKIFARITPFHKSRIVSLYQKLGEVVAVTGDGVNDSIALKQADVGIAMGKIGTDVARETADMVITDDNFATIIIAVEEGRNIVKRLKNGIKYLLTGNLTEGLVLVVGLILGFPPLLLPIQLLYINLISDGVPALAMAFSPKDPNVMREKPTYHMTLLPKKDIQYIMLVALSSCTIILSSYIYGRGLSELYAGTLAFSLLAMIQSFFFVDIWLSHRSIFKHLHILKSKVFIGTILFPFTAQFIIVTTPFFSELFHIAQLTPAQYLLNVLTAFFIVLPIFIIKKLVYR